MREEVELAAERILRGDGADESFEIIYRAWLGRLERYFSRKGVPPESREDLVQDSLIRIYKGLRRLDGIKNFEGYFWITTRNVFNRWLERKAREAAKYGERIAYLPETPEELDAAVSDEPWPTPFARLGSPDGDLHERQLWERLERLIGELPGKTRQCAWLSFMEGLSNRKIALMMGIAPGNVGYKLHQVRQRPPFVSFFNELQERELRER